MDLAAARATQEVSPRSRGRLEDCRHLSIHLENKLYKKFVAMDATRSAYGGEVRSCHCLGCPDMVGKDYHLYRVSFVGDFARSMYEKARTEWVDAKNDVVIEFEFDDQPVVYMKYSANAKPMIIYKTTEQNLGIIVNYEMATWSVQDFSEVDEAAF